MAELETVCSEDQLFVNEDLSDEEVNISEPHVTIRRKALKSFLDIVQRLPDRVKDSHCVFFMLDVDAFETDNGTMENRLTVSATDNSSATMIKMSIPVLNKTAVYEGKPVILKQSMLQKLDNLLLGDNLTLKFIEDGEHVHVRALVLGGWLDVPTGNFSESVFDIPLNFPTWDKELSVSEMQEVLSSLLVVAKAQKTPNPNLVFKDGYAFVDDTGGYVRYDCDLFVHRLPLWSAEILASFLSKTQSKSLRAYIQTESKNNYPYVRFVGDQFEFALARFGTVSVVHDKVQVSAGIITSLDSLKRIASIPAVMQDDMRDFFNGNILVSFVKDGDDEELSVTLCGKNNGTKHVIHHEVFGEVRNYFTVCVNAAQLSMLLKSCPSSCCDVVVTADVSELHISSGAWSCHLDLIKE